MSESRSKHELIIMALQQRIGEMSATYEGQIASLRADLTQLLDVEKIAHTDTKKEI